MFRDPRLLGRIAVLCRRHWLKSLALFVCLPALPDARAAAYPATIAAMQSARETETRVYYHYIEFARRAQQDRYRGIAYLFSAFASSEQVHATNFGKILTRLNVELAPIPKPAVRLGSTRENLMRAADSEMHSIEDFYPKLLEQLQPEGHDDAITLVHYAPGCPSSSTATRSSRSSAGPAPSSRPSHARSTKGRAATSSARYAARR